MVYVGNKDFPLFQKVWFGSGAQPASHLMDSEVVPFNP